MIKDVFIIQFLHPTITQKNKELRSKLTKAYRKIHLVRTILGNMIYLLYNFYILYYSLNPKKKIVTNRTTKTRENIHSMCTILGNKKYIYYLAIT
jgi:hypothetical protein